MMLKVFMFLIDGHNLIGAMPDIDLADADDEWQLVQRLQAYAARSRRSLHVVFDAGPGPSPRWRQPPGDSVKVHFAPRGTEADAVILRLLRRSQAPGQVTVITNDRQLAGHVRAAGGQVRSASRFARQLAPDRGAGGERVQPVQDPIDPLDPAFSDIYQGFVAADKDRSRFGAEIDRDAADWIERLYGENLTEVARAAHWLGRFGGSEALEPLRDALTHSNGQVRAAALLALADLGERSAVAAVADRLARDNSSMVREAAAQSLARLGGPEAEAALQAALSDPKRKVRKAAEKGLAEVRARKDG